MAYNSKNRLQRIIDIQNIYLRYSQEGVTGEYIFTKYIQPIYRISRATFYNYLALNAKKELKDLNESNTKLKAIQCELF